MEKLVRETMSICPECFRVIPARIIKRDGKLFLVKDCPDHGHFEELYWTDYDLYQNYMKYFNSGPGIENPQVTKNSKGCPYDCGLCPLHMSSSVLTNIDVTNRCNFRCPICFANAAEAGYVWEPSIDEIERMIDNLLNERPPGLAVQFSGGEPTVRDDLPEMISLAKRKGIKQVMIATNGARIAEDYEYYKRLRDAGLSTIYLQFDGLTPKPYIAARGFNALPLKVRAIENTRKLGEDGKAPTVVLVPTVVKGINDGEIGGIIKYAAKNVDVVKGISFQPVAITGRISREKREKMRITIPELLDRIEEQTNGQITKGDFYPIPVVHPIIEWLKVVSKDGGKNYPNVRTHPVCGVGTYVFVYGDKLVPITRLVDIDKLVRLAEKKVSKAEVMLRFATLIKRTGFKYVREFLPVLTHLILNGSFEAASIFHTLPNILFIGAMHFQDPYNFDVERVMRCVIHYALPNGKIIPFCAYNNLYRKEYEKRYSRPPTDEERKEFEEQVKKINEWREEFKDYRVDI